MATNDLWSKLSEEDKKYVEESERLTRIISAIMEAANERNETIKKEGRRVQGDNESLRQTVESQKAELEKTASSIEVLKKANQELENRIVTLQKNGASNEEIEKLKKQSENNKKKIKKLQDDKKMVTDWINSILESGKKGNITVKLKEVGKLINQLQSERDWTEFIARKNAEELEELRRELDETRVGLSASSEAYREAAKQNQVNEKNLTSAQRQQRRILEHMSKDKEELRKDIKALQDQLNTVTKVAEAKQKEIDELRAKGANGTDLQRLEKERNALIQERDNLAADFNYLRQQLEELKIDRIRNEIYKEFRVDRVDAEGKSLGISARLELLKAVGPINKIKKGAQANAIQRIISNLHYNGIDTDVDEICDILKAEKVSSIQQSSAYLKNRRALSGPARGKALKTLLTVVLTLVAVASAIGVGWGLFGDRQGKVNEQHGVIAGQEETITNQQGDINALTLTSYQEGVETSSKYIKSEAEKHDVTEGEIEIKNVTHGVTFNESDSVVTGMVDKMQTILKETESLMTDYQVAVQNYTAANASGDTQAMQTSFKEVQTIYCQLGTAADQYGDTATTIEDVAESKGIQLDSSVTSNIPTLCSQMRSITNEMNEYYLDLLNEPVYNVSFDSATLNQYNADLVVGAGKAVNMLSCTYERETGKVTMLIECKSNKGASVVEKEFNMGANRAVINVDIIMNEMQEAAKNKEVTFQVYDTEYTSESGNQNVSMSVNGSTVTGTAKIMYEVKAEYDRTLGSNGMTNVLSNAIVMIYDNDGNVIGTKTFENNYTLLGKYTVEEVKDSAVAELINKVNSSLAIETQTDKVME